MSLSALRALVVNICATRYEGMIFVALNKSRKWDSSKQTDTNPNGVPQEVFDDMAKQMQEDRFAFLENFGKDFFGVNMLSHPVSNQDLLDFISTVQ